MPSITYSIVLKKQLDSSEIMANFCRHRTQIGIKDSLNDSSFKTNSIDYKSVFTESMDQIKDKIVQDYRQKLESNTSNLRRQLEGQYRAEIQELQAKSDQKEVLLQEQKAKMSEKEDKLTLLDNVLFSKNL